MRPTRRFRSLFAIITSAVAVASLGVLPASAASGDSTWNAHYPYGYLQETVASPNGGKVFVTGSIPNGSATAFLTIAYNASSGRQLWDQTFANGWQGPNMSIAISPDGATVFVTGSRVDDVTYKADWVTIAYRASTGEQLWMQMYDGSGVGSSSEPTSVGVSPDGSAIFVTGSSGDGAGGLNYETVSYDASTGRLRWAASHANGSATSLAVSRSGRRVYVIGSDYSGGTSAMGTIAYDASTGVQRWMSRWDGPDTFGSYGIDIVLAAGGVFVTGDVYTSADGSDYATVGYQSRDGALLWDRLYEGSQDNSDENAASIAAAPDGSTVYVTGRGYVADSETDWATLAYDTASGDTLWTQGLDGGDNYSDWANEVAVAPDGSGVYVTGVIIILQDADVFEAQTVGYDPTTGGVLWSKTYDDGDSGNALAVTRKAVFVAGTGAFEGTTGQAGLTISYER